MQPNVGNLRLDDGGHPINIFLRLNRRYAWLQPRHRPIVEVVSLCAFLDRRETHWDPEILLGEPSQTCRSLKSWRHHPDDGVWPAVQLDRFAENLRIALKALLP